MLNFKIIFTIITIINSVYCLPDLLPRRIKRQQPQQQQCLEGDMVLNYPCNDNFTCTNAFGPTARCTNSMCCKPNVNDSINPLNPNQPSDPFTNPQNDQNQCNNGGIKLNIQCTDNTPCQSAAGNNAVCINGQCCSGNSGINPQPNPTDRSTTCPNNGISMNLPCQNTQTCRNAGGSFAQCSNGNCCLYISQNSSTISPQQCQNKGYSLNISCKSTKECQSYGGSEAICENGNCCSGNKNQTSTIQPNLCPNNKTPLNFQCRTDNDCHRIARDSECINSQCCGTEERQ